MRNTDQAKAATPVAWMRDFLAHPAAAAPGALHPSYAYLSDRDLDSLAAYLTEMK